MSDPTGLREFLPAYLAEVADLLAAASTQLLTVENSMAQGGHNPRAVRELFRALHTIKGLSAMVDIDPVVAIAHRMEAALRAADRAGGRLEPHAVEPLHAGMRAIETRVRALAGQKPVTAPPAALLDALDALDVPDTLDHGETGSPLAPPPVSLDLEPAIQARLAPFELDQLIEGVRAGQRAVRVDFVPSPERITAGLTINSVRTRMAALGEIVKVIPVHRPAVGGAPSGIAFALLVLTLAPDAALIEAVGGEPDAIRLMSSPVTRTPPTTRTPLVSPTTSGSGPPGALDDGLDPPPDETTPQHRGFVRVEVRRLDHTMEQLAALIVGRSRLAMAVADLTARNVDTRAIVQILVETTRQLRDLRAAILRVRMVSVGEILDRLPLIVRGLRRESGKQVRIELDVGSAELDKAVGERIFPAIVHLVRNAVDHAIEAPDERLRKGKPAEGVVRIACHERSNTQLELTVQDDGAGVDRAAVARKVGAEVPPTDAALLELLCRPGLSTRDAVTTTSGRGMGMDIVKRIAVEELGGLMSLTTTPGAGSMFTLCVPLSLSIVDAFVFECGSQRFAVPVRLVDEIIEIDPATVVYGPDSGGKVGLVGNRGIALPVVSLDARLGLAQRVGHGHRGLVVRHGETPLAFSVDRIIGQQEIVVRPLEDPLVRVTGIAGATDLGDGQPTLVLDLVGMGASALQRRSWTGGAA